MRKIKNILLITIFMLLVGVSFNVKAEQFDYYITNSNNYGQINNNDVKSIKRGDTITVTAMLRNGDDVANYKINSGKLTIRWDDKYLSLQEVNGKYFNDSISDVLGLTFSSINKSSNKITINEISSSGILKAKLNKLAEFKFKVLETASFGETKIYQMDGEDNLKCMNSEEAIIPCGESLLSELKYNILKSTNNKLSRILVDGKELGFFNEDTNDYDIEVDSLTNKIKIEATKTDSHSTITGNIGDNEVIYGVNRYEIVVTSESGEKNIYHINVNKIDARSNDNTLKTLTISTGEINFKTEITEYTVNLDNNVEKLTITSSLNDSKAKYVENYQNKEINLVEGSNKVEIKILSEKGEERVYTLNINRALSSNNSLKSLKVNDEKIELKEGEFIYNITVANDVEEAIIKAEPNDIKATVELLDKYPLVVGDNEVKIIVTAASGTKASYIININRMKILSPNSLLTSLKIEGYDINFKQETTLYNLKIKDEDSELKITTTTEDPFAKVEIEGNKDLVNGSIIKINVKAEDGTYTRYFINIEKGTTGMSPIIKIIIALLILLAIIIGIIFYRKKKDEKKEFEKLDKDEEKKEEEITVHKEEPIGDDNIVPGEIITQNDEVSDNTISIANDTNIEDNTNITYSRVSRLEEGTSELPLETEINEQKKDIE